MSVGELAKAYAARFKGSRVILGGRVGSSAVRVAFEAGFKAGAGEWFPVARFGRMPEEGEKVLAVGYGGGFYLAWMKGGQLVTFEDGGYRERNLAFWRPLPESPIKKESPFAEDWEDA